MKISFVSLGCDKNLVDSEIMLGLIKEDNHTIEDDYKEADIIIINTCGFIMDATEEGIEIILDLAEHKKNGKCKGLIVTGCMAQRYKDEIFKELPEVDAVVGTSEYDKIGDVIKKVLENEQVTLVTDANKNLAEELGYKRVLSTGHYGYLKIAEGCDKNCTYCTIPSLRGSYRSRNIETLVKEAENLAKKGLVELILVAQDTSLYGTDIYGEQRLHILLQELSKIEGIEWIRILYCYPEHIYDGLIEEMKNNDKVCKYIDMPIQHSNDEILRLMNRQSSEEKLRNVVEKLRTEIPDITIRTTLIVGFPQETDEHFKSLVKFIEEVKFDRLGVFKYSQEDGTPASRLEQVDEDIKNERFEYISEVQKNISRDLLLQYEGELVKVMVDGRIPEDNIYTGRMENSLIDVDGCVFFKCDYEVYSGDFVEVRVKETHDYDLLGDVEYES